MDWIKEKLADLKLEFDTGASASDIAKALTIKFQEDVTRNAVLGILNRMKLHRPPKPPPEKKEKLPPIPQQRRLVARSPPVIVKWEVEPPSIYRCTIYQLDDSRCHWPFGDRPPYMYCGAAVTCRGYCNFHYQKAIKVSEHEHYRHRNSRYHY